MKTFLAALATGAIVLGLAGCGDNDDSSPTVSNQATLPETSRAVALDSTFGNNGIAHVPLSTATNDRFMAVAVAPDGKTYGAGFTVDGGDQSLAVARLTATGALDTSFGKGGIASVNAAAGGKAVELARAVVIQSNGKIVIAGPIEHDTAATGDAARDTDIAVARFDSTGTLDATFGRGGISIIDLGAGRATSATAFVGDTSWGMGVLPGDKIVLFGSTLGDGADRTDTDYAVVGLTANGALDTAFGTAGRTIVDVSRTSDNPRNLLVQPDGKIVATGYSNVDGVVSPVLIRLSAAGVLDSTFGKAGVASAKVLPGVAESYNVSRQGSDYILAGYGRGSDATEKVDMIVYRFKGNGTWDETFGTSGITRVDIAKEDDRARNVMVLPDGRILAAGSGKRTALEIDAMLVLFTKDGARVPDFGENGVLISDLGGPADAWYGIALSADKKQVMVAGYKGTTEGAGNDDAVIARINI